MLGRAQHYKDWPHFSGLMKQELLDCMMGRGPSAMLFMHAVQVCCRNPVRVGAMCCTLVAVKDAEKHPEGLTAAQPLLTATHLPLVCCPCELSLGKHVEQAITQHWGCRQIAENALSSPSPCCQTGQVPQQWMHQAHRTDLWMRTCGASGSWQPGPSPQRLSHPADQLG